MKHAFFSALPAALAACLLTACAVNPVTGKRQVSLVSENQELAMGQQADPAVIAEFGLYPDKKIQRFISDKGQAMAAVSHRANLPFQFKVVDSPVINAFALPGYVYFTRGILAHFNNEAQFAGVLGHEIGHVTARHTAQQQSKQLLGQVALIGGMIASPTLARYGEQAMQGMGLLFLKFGRDDERQADELGVEYSSAIKYDASQMADFFQTLQREQQVKGGQAIPDFMSSHPNPGERYETVHQLADKYKTEHPTTKLAVNRDQYLRLIDGLTYGEDPRQGFVEGGIFYHPDLKFQFPVPTGWASQNSPQQFQMAPKDGKAMMMFTLAPGTDLAAAAKAFTTQFKLQVTDSRQLTINGFPALAVQADQAGATDPQTGQAAPAQVRTLSTFIQDGKTVYAFLGATSVTDFATYAPIFAGAPQGFQRLTDREKLARQPEKISIRTVKQSTTLADFLRANGVAAKRLEEHAILNGMQLTDRIGNGLLVKVAAR
ncbi:MAG: M48 family metalloprotease [Hymenobacteraceae bacterium]|nr:M48 family metalloprotease [Hymenobacteraceae bacterium]